MFTVGEADAYAHQNDYDHAVQDYSSAFQLDPEKVGARRAVGDVHYNNERYADALRHYSRAVDA